MEPSSGVWGIARVTPGGSMDQAGMRGGDRVLTHHGDAFAELSRAISDAATGRSACVLVFNAEDARTGSGREVRLKGTTKN